MLRVPYSDLLAAFERALLTAGVAPARAELCARIFAETTRDGVYSHGLNRFARFIAAIRNGSIQPNAEPECTASFGAIERWDGHIAPGNTSAYASMLRAVELARQHGLGCVALANTTHWMRGGTYGWLAAEAGLFSLCWTNTLPNLPAWGASTPTLGNNPLVIGIPRAEGHIVLDMAMSQFSYGALATYKKRNEPLPVDGGFDAEGQPTRDAATIEATQRLLPVGYWKGSGLALVLDMLAAMLSGGKSTHQIPNDTARESGISQVFLAIDPSNFASASELTRIADSILDDLHAAPRADPAKPIRYPGEQTLQLRKENMELGVPVDPAHWQQLQTQNF
ncbi:3-dehydro-L-gulonate 2-dehydrogenase [Granulicella sp. dw_53]|uniref:3-dehydro-L-gulonate 2-dehydrogenase n=1 Tax=Granulicella sp. dw_53 TaxID=2719792 RepID=UPI001BD293DE|nr:3-dehydro-L-gulonate 2-dehydrogenase [Granulicella sp. dw_53]